MSLPPLVFTNNGTAGVPDRLAVSLLMEIDNDNEEIDIKQTPP
jgi:hypothetical protein